MTYFFAFTLNAVHRKIKKVTNNVRIVVQWCGAPFMARRTLNAGGASIERPPKTDGVFVCSKI